MAAKKPTTKTVAPQKPKKPTFVQRAMSWVRTLLAIGLTLLVLWFVAPWAFAAWRAWSAARAARAVVEQVTA
jgi:hypothetical protein